MAEVPTPEELDGLMTGGPAPAPASKPVPAPSPKVVARATEIVTGTAPAPTLETDPVTEQDRVRFLAHVLNGVPFERRYTVFGTMTLEFGVISAGAERMIHRVLGDDEATGHGTQADRKSRYADYSAFLALRRFDVDGVDRTPKCPVQNPTPAEVRACAQAFYDAIPKPTYQVIRDRWSAFAALYQGLVRRAHDSPFWTTPSSAPSPPR